MAYHCAVHSNYADYYKENEITNKSRDEGKNVVQKSLETPREGRKVEKNWYKYPPKVEKVSHKKNMNEGISTKHENTWNRC